MGVDITNQDEVALVSLRSASGLADIKDVVDEFIRGISAPPAPLRGRPPYTVEMVCFDSGHFKVTTPYGAARVRKRFRAAGEYPEAVFCVERPGDAELGEHPFVNIGKFTISHTGIAMLP